MKDHYLRIIKTDEATRKQWDALNPFDQGVYHCTDTGALMTAWAVRNEIRADDVNWEEKPRFEAIEAALTRLEYAGFLRLVTGDELERLLTGG